MQPGDGGECRKRRRQYPCALLQGEEERDLREVALARYVGYEGNLRRLSRTLWGFVRMGR